MAEKYRNYEAIIYPESLPEDWLEILEDTHVPIVISPLHDSDVDKKTGEVKKSHYHLGIKFEGPSRASQALTVLSPLKVPRVVPIRSLGAWQRYLCHLDNPEKAQYSPDDIICLSGASCSLVRDLTKEDRQRAISDMCSWIEENDCTEFAALTRHCLVNNPEWFEVINSSATIFFRAYLSSRRHQTVASK
jgi:hypothetical protein